MKNVWTQKTLETAWANFRKCLESEVAEEFLQALLTLMGIVFFVSPEYRRNIEGFRGRYQFSSQDGKITVAALFENGRMRVLEKEIPRPDVKVTFRDGRVLLNFLLAPKKDVLGSMLCHDVETEGNLNYVYKFAYMAKQLELKFAPR